MNQDREHQVYKVRKAVQGDLPFLLEFEQELIKIERPMDPTIRDGNISYYDIASFIKSDDVAVYVVEDQGEVLASGYARIKDDRPYLKHKKQGYLGFMFVPEAHRGKGLNQLIVNALLHWCKNRGVHEIRLDVYEDNPSAIRAYEKAGFRKHMITMRMDISKEDT